MCSLICNGIKAAVIRRLEKYEINTQNELTKLESDSIIIVEGVQERFKAYGSVLLLWQ